MPETKNPFKIVDNSNIIIGGFGYFIVLVKGLHSALNAILARLHSANIYCVSESMFGASSLSAASIAQRKYLLC